MSTIFKRLQSKTDLFLQTHPSLLLLSRLLVSISLFLNSLWCAWVCVFWAFLIGKKRFWATFLPLTLLLYGDLFLYIGNFHFQGSLKGRALLHLQKVNLVQGSFGRNWVYTGVVRKLEVENGRIIRHLPFTCYLPGKLKRPLANKDYWVDIELLKSDFYGFKVKIDKEARFKEVPYTYSLAEKRYFLKEKFKKFIHQHIPFKNAQTFLVGMATGDFQDNFLAYTFSRFGLNHLLAISGFHFALLAIFLSFLLKWAPLNLRLLFLATLLTSFYLFVGYGPSLQRAWIVAIVYIWSLYQKRIVTSINVLSISMILVLAMNPFMLMHLGFQFSFMITFAILIYTHPCFIFLKKIFPPISKIDGAVLKALALGLAVHVAALPICLHHFHKFYWIGFILNLIVPAIVSFLLFGFMSVLLLYPLIPKLASFGLYAVGYLAEKLVQAIFWLPTSLDYCLRVPVSSAILMQGFILLFFLGAVWLQKENYSPIDIVKIV